MAYTYLCPVCGARTITKCNCCWDCWVTSRADCKCKEEDERRAKEIAENNRAEDALEKTRIATDVTSDCCICGRRHTSSISLLPGEEPPPEMICETCVDRLT